VRICGRVQHSTMGSIRKLKLDLTDSVFVYVALLHISSHTPYVLYMSKFKRKLDVREGESEARNENIFSCMISEQSDL
jgi:hypothetical protein